MLNFNIEKVLLVSSKHIPEEDIRYLYFHTGRFSLRCAVDAHRVCSNLLIVIPTQEEYQEQLDKIKGSPLSTNFEFFFMRAYLSKCRYLVFTDDVEPYEDLEVFKQDDEEQEDTHE